MKLTINVVTEGNRKGSPQPITVIKQGLTSADQEIAHRALEQAFGRQVRITGPGALTVALPNDRMKGAERYQVEGAVHDIADSFKPINA